MKLPSHQLLLFGLFSISVGQIVSKQTPKAITLTNTATPQQPLNSASILSSSALSSYVHSSPESFIPPLESAKKLSAEIPSTNIASDATKIISPQIADPKIKVETEMTYPANVEVPSFYGFKKELVNSLLYDKVSGRIVNDTVVVNKPILRNEETVMNINRKSEHTYNLRNGELMTDSRKNVTMHGI